VTYEFVLEISKVTVNGIGCIWYFQLWVIILGEEPWHIGFLNSDRRCAASCERVFFCPDHLFSVHQESFST